MVSPKNFTVGSPVTSDPAPCLEHIPKAEKSGAWSDQRLLSTQQRTNPERNPSWLDILSVFSYLSGNSVSVAKVASTPRPLQF